MKYDSDMILKLNEQSKEKTPEQILALAAEAFPGRVTLATSFGMEDQALTHMVKETAPDMPVFSLDTGRLFPETYELIEVTEKKYQIRIKLYYPDTQEVEAMVGQHGINLFYESIEKRKLCCKIRKIDPLQRALREYDAWICGLRRAQAVSRASLQVFEWDGANQRVKISPLAGWDLQQVEAFVRSHSVPVNSLHDKGFVSIGCQCCTRAVKPGEDIRAGRWWWEEASEKKECGLHQKKEK